MPAKKRPAPKENGHLASVVKRNIETIMEVRRQMERKKTMQDAIADGIAGFTGSMWFVYFHAVLFGGWIAANLGAFGIEPFDPFPFGLLTMIVSLEAIFLSTFILINQNRQARLGDDRADLDLQIDLLAEYETTRTLKIVDAVANKLKLREGKDPELPELERTIEPGELLKEIERCGNEKQVR